MSSQYASPSAVSRKLKAEGITVTASRKRQGVHVTQSLHGVCVTADFDSTRETAAHVLYVKEILTKAGYSVSHSDGSSVLFISKPYRSPDVAVEPARKPNYR